MSSYPQSVGMYSNMTYNNSVQMYIQLQNLLDHYTPAKHNKAAHTQLRESRTLQLVVCVLSRHFFPSISRAKNSEICTGGGGLQYMCCRGRGTGERGEGRGQGQGWGQGARVGWGQGAGDARYHYLVKFNKPVYLSTLTGGRLKR